MSSAIAHKEYLKKNHCRCCEIIAGLDRSVNDNVIPLSCVGLDYDGHRDFYEDCVVWCSLNSCESVFVKCLVAIIGGSMPHNPYWLRLALQIKCFHIASSCFRIVSILHAFVSLRYQIIWHVLFERLMAQIMIPCPVCLQVGSVL
jgi:hypothetical protein